MFDLWLVIGALNRFGKCSLHGLHQHQWPMHWFKEVYIYAFISVNIYKWIDSSLFCCVLYYTLFCLSSYTVCHKEINIRNKEEIKIGHQFHLPQPKVLPPNDSLAPLIFSSLILSIYTVLDVPFFFFFNIIDLSIAHFVVQQTYMSMYI